MFSSKAKVDKHVSSLLQGYKTQIEKNKVGFQIAKQYYQIKEYQTALRYLDGYLQIKSDFYQAHALQGKIFEGLKQAHKAIEAYKRSLVLNEDQNDTLLRICALYCDVDIDVDRARYWAEKLEKVYPDHEILLRLREKIYATGDMEENQKELEGLYEAELRKRPHDVRAHIKLLRLHVENEWVNKAYTRALLEEKEGLHSTSLDWYRCLLDVFQEYERESGQKINGDYHTQLLWVQYNVTLLSLEQAKVADAVEAIQKFDQALHSVQCLSCNTAQWNVFLKEMQAQLHFLSAVLLLKKARDTRQDWSEACLLASPCFLLSYSVPPPNIKAAWYAQADPADHKMYQRWYSAACLRAGQSGHMMNILGGPNIKSWVNQVQEELCNTQGRERMFQVIFDHPSVQSDCQSSYLFNNSQFTTFTPVVPVAEELKQMDQVVEKLRPDKLDYILWHALQYYSIRDQTQPDYDLRLFDDCNLQYGVYKLDTANPVSLCLQDIEAFLYAVVYDSAHNIQQALPERGVPTMLPVIISEPISTPEQRKWWTAVYNLVHNTKKKKVPTATLR